MEELKSNEYQFQKTKKKPEDKSLEMVKPEEAHLEAPAPVEVNHEENKLLSRPIINDITPPEFSKGGLKDLEKGLFNIFKSKLPY